MAKSIAASTSSSRAVGSLYWVYYRTGRTHYSLEAYADAIEYFSRALVASGLVYKWIMSPGKLIAKKDAHTLANMLFWLGESYLAVNQLSTALAVLRWAREAYCRYDNFDKKGDPLLFVGILNSIGHLCSLCGNVYEMIQAINEAHNCLSELPSTPKSVALATKLSVIGVFTSCTAPAA
jgi:tetratricopeptide (TPR) repeat protein